MHKRVVTPVQSIRDIDVGGEDKWIEVACICKAMEQTVRRRQNNLEIRFWGQCNLTLHISWRQEEEKEEEEKEEEDNEETNNEEVENIVRICQHMLKIVWNCVG